jgi:peptide-N4-(N-acetyl-beta-glucosaminyl)asparagine amidase
VLIYEDPDLKRKALNLIPVEILKQEATSKFDSYKSTPSLDKLPFAFEDFLLIELLAWFKNEFFRWVNQAECDSCGNPNTVPRGSTRPNHSEVTWMAGNVEVYE